MKYSVFRNGSKKPVIACNELEAIFTTVLRGCNAHTPAAKKRAYNDLKQLLDVTGEASEMVTFHTADKKEYSINFLIKQNKTN